MKTFKHIVLRTLVAFCLLTSAVVVIETTTETHAAQAGQTLDQKCVAYLIAHGYTNVSVIGYEGENRICDTSYSYNTRVIVVNGVIVDYEDITG